MANWAYIENQKILEVVDELPQNWKNVSNLHALESDVSFLKKLGWYSIVHNRVDYDPKTQDLKSVTITLDNNNVYETYIAVNKDVDVFYHDFMEKLRNKRNKLLQDSDYTCLSDLVSVKGKEWLNDIGNYRQQLRDMPNLFPNTGVYYDFDSIVWPIMPNINDYPKDSTSLGSGGTI